MKIFCRTDQEVICYLCSMDDHRGHDTVPAAAERAVKQEELGESQEKIQQRIDERVKDIKVLQQKVESINLSADAAVRDSEKVFTEMIRLIRRRSSEVTQQIRLQQKSEAKFEVIFLGIIYRRQTSCRCNAVDAMTEKGRITRTVHSCDFDLTD
ncbi:uncharacterized protein V6R79_013522 [Siganus canaliculatus]